MGQPDTLTAVLIGAALVALVLAVRRFRSRRRQRASVPASPDMSRAVRAPRRPWLRGRVRWPRPQPPVSRPSRPAPRDPGAAIGTSWRSYAAEAPAWCIVAGAMAVSFWTQVDAVQQHAFARWEALIWGTSTDFGTLACLFLAREGAYRGTPTWGAWMLSVACALMSVQFNVVDGLQHGDWLAVEAHVWMPALALGVWYWTLHGRHRRWASSGRQPVAKLDLVDVRDTSEDVESDGQPGSARARREEVTEGAYRAAVEALPPGTTAAALADALGVSTKTVGRLRKRYPDVESGRDMSEDRADLSKAA